MKTNFKGLIDQATKWTGKHSPEILLGVGIVGMITAGVLAVKATPKAVKTIEADSKLAHDGDPNAYTKKEAVQSAWKYYIPAVGTGVASIACIVGAGTINLRRSRALLTAYTISEGALAEYKTKVLDLVGPKKVEEIRDAIAKDKLEEHPVTDKTVIYNTGNGNQRCFDPYSGTYFFSTIDKLKKAENTFNYQLLREDTQSLNDFYYLIDLNGIKVGDDIGWDIANGQLELRFSAQLPEDGIPTIVIDFNIHPTYAYLNRY